MIGYCLNRNQCRRAQIAAHFGESWEPSWCQRKCDVCAEDATGCSSLDVTVSARQLIALARSALQKQQRVTGLKLTEGWLKTEKGRRISKTFAETLIGNLLLEGYLKEDFHFTPYNIISYLVPGRKADLLEGNQKVTITVADGKVKANGGSGPDAKRAKRPL